METHEDTPIYRILVIDDNLSIHEDFKKILIGQSETHSALDDMELLLFGDQVGSKHHKNDGCVRFEVEFASQGQEGLGMVKNAKKQGNPFSMAFVDGRMPPGWDGIETIRYLWQESPELQTVLCTAYADYSWQEIRQVLGESDSLLILKKPFDNVEVLQMAHALSQKWKLNQEINGRLNRLAFYDNLTGLPNRGLFLDRLKAMIDSHKRYQHKGALLFIDLDNFKRINDTLGHNVGDQLLKIMAERLLKSLRGSDTVSCTLKDRTAARLGGDEFTVLLPEISDQKTASMVAQRIIDHVASPVTIEQNELMVTPSIGIAIFPDDGDNADILMKNADLAMYVAKRDAPGEFRYFQESMNDRALKRLSIENQLRQAIDRKELYLNYQPQVLLPSEELIGVEALLRWDNQKLGMVPPDAFIPVAEECGLIIDIGAWVLHAACEQFMAWKKSGLFIRRIAVNVSVRQFIHPGFIKMVEDVLYETRMPPGCLEIEITESLFAQDIEKISKILKLLRSRQIQVAVDDFGTGYSSLSRLKEMPVDCLKIDRSFICGISSGVGDKSIISAIMSMARGMNLRVVAEGVDNTEQLDFLTATHCPEAQGFFFHRPLSSLQVEMLLKHDCLRKDIMQKEQTV